MKRIPVLAALLLTALVVALPAAPADRTVTILHVSDTHSHLDAVGPRDASLQGTVGGIAKATTVIGRARA